MRCDRVDARDGLQELKLRAEGFQLLIRLQVEHLDVGIELFDVREVHAQQEPMMLREPALESVDDLLPVGVHAVVDQTDQHSRVTLARDHGFNDGATALTHDVGKNGRELDIRALQGLMDPLNVPALLAHELRGSAGQIAELLDGWGRHEARPDQAMGKADRPAIANRRRPSCGPAPP